MLGTKITLLCLLCLVANIRLVTSVEVNGTECQGTIVDGTPPDKTCEDYIHELVGCCPDHDLLDCADDFPDENGKQVGDPSKCHSFEVCTLDKVNQTHWVCLPRESKYRSMMIGDRNTRKQLPPRLGRPCNTKLYDKKMRPIWYSYLQCPHRSSVEARFQDLVDDVGYYPEFLDDLCFSEFIEECHEGRCRCLSKVFEYTKNGGGVLLNFTQFQHENSSCGLYAGIRCIHNTNNVRFNDIDPSYCTRSQKPMVGDIVPQPFECERNAACFLDFKAKHCPLISSTPTNPDNSKSCGYCKCAKDFKCNDGSRTGSGIIFLLIGITMARWGTKSQLI